MNNNPEMKKQTAPPKQPNNNMQVYYGAVIANLEEAAKTDRFASKDDFNKYIEQMKKNGNLEITEEEKKKLLETYDENHKSEEAGLDMTNYQGTRIEEQNYVIAKDTDTVLKTDASSKEIPDEFKKNQNTLAAANSQDELANAQTVFNEMKNKIHEEVTLAPIYEMVERQDASQELLDKIRFFITNRKINPFGYKVSKDGVFYNSEKDEMLEVKKNPKTGKFEIIKGSQVVYSEDEQTETYSEEEERSEDKGYTPEEVEKEGIENQKKNDNPKVRRLIPEKQRQDQAAFVKSGVLIITFISVVILLSMLILFLR